MSEDSEADAKTGKKSGLQKLLGRFGRKLVYREGGNTRFFGQKNFSGFHKRMVVGTVRRLARTNVMKPLELEGLIDRTWREGISLFPISDEEISAPCKHVKLDDAGVYKVSVQVPGHESVDHFVKVLANQRSYEHVRSIHKELAGKLECIDALTCEDPVNRVIGTVFHEGELLYDYLRSVPEHDRKLVLFNVVDKLAKNYASVEHIDGSRVLSRLPGVGKGYSSFSEQFLHRFVLALNHGLKRKSRSLLKRHSKKRLDSALGRNPGISRLVDTFREEMGDGLDSLEQTLCHGDLHVGNIIYNGDVNIVDWEYAFFAPVQFDLVKLLKRAGITKETERAVLRYAFDKVVQERSSAAIRNYDEMSGDPFPARIDISDDARDRFEKGYHQMAVYEKLCTAARYFERAQLPKFSEDKDSLESMAHVLYTDALEAIRGSRLESELKKAMEGFEYELVDLKEHEAAYDRYGSLDSNSRLSIENIGGTTIIQAMEEKTTLERASNVLDRLVPAAVLAFALGAGGNHLANKVVMSDHRDDLAMREEAAIRSVGVWYDQPETRFIRSRQPRIRELGWDYVQAFERHANAYDDVSVDDLKVLARAENYVWGNNEAGYANIEDSFYRTFSNRNQLGLPFEQTRLDYTQAHSVDNAVFAAAHRLSRMKQRFSDLEDALAAYFWTPEDVRRCKSEVECESYWHYSRNESFPEEVRQFVDSAMWHYRQVGNDE